MARDDRRTLDWDAICANAALAYPSVDNPQFVKHLATPGLIADIMRDFLRLENLTTTGVRETPELEVGLARLNELLGNGYSMDPFPKAMRVCTRQQSVRQIARKTGLSKTRVGMLLAGDAAPTAHDMEQVAKAYDRQPTWFAAYRTHVIVTMVTAAVERNPEQSAVLVRRLLS